MELSGIRICIHELKVEDAYFFANWGTHQSPLFYDYNYQHHGVMGYRRWFESRNHMFQHYFGIYLEERFIGFIGMKKINPLTKNSELGLVIDPNFTNRGIGLEAMAFFLEYYFFKLKMKTMTLKVTKYNKAAIKLYRKLGFRFIGESRSLLEIKTSNVMHPEVQKYAFYLHRDCFGRIWEEVWKMKIGKEDFEKRGRNEVSIGSVNR